MWNGILLLAHAAATWFLCGLIWTMQCVHYPLFSHVQRDRFAAFEQEHQRRITLLVGPAMILELLLALLLVRARDDRWAWAGLALLIVVWLSTALWQVPLHGALRDGFAPEPHRALVHGNWLRTVAWTARGVIALRMLRSE